MALRPSNRLMSHRPVLSELALTALHHLSSRLAGNPRTIYRELSLRRQTRRNQRQYPSRIISGRNSYRAIHPQPLLLHHLSDSPLVELSSVFPCLSPLVPQPSRTCPPAGSPRRFVEPVFLPPSSGALFHPLYASTREPAVSAGQREVWQPLEMMFRQHPATPRPCKT